MAPNSSASRAWSIRTISPPATRCRRRRWPTRASSTAPTAPSTAPKCRRWPRASSKACCRSDDHGYLRHLFHLPPRAGHRRRPAGAAGRAGAGARRTPQGPGQHRRRAAESAGRLRTRGRPRRYRRPDHANAFYRAEHHLDAATAGRELAGRRRVQPAAEERRGGDGDDLAAGVRAAGPATRCDGLLDRQREKPQRRHAADDAFERRRRPGLRHGPGQCAGRRCRRHLARRRRLAGGQPPERGPHLGRRHGRARGGPALGENNMIRLELNNTDFATAGRIVEAINDKYGSGIAYALDGRVIRVQSPSSSDQRVAFIGALEDINVNPARQAAKVIMNARTGSVVMNQSVTLETCAISHGNLSISVSSEPQVSQPNALSGGRTVVTQGNGQVDIKKDSGKVMLIKGGASLADVVKALNAIGATPQDLLAILQAMKVAGALHAELEII